MLASSRSAPVPTRWFWVADAWPMGIGPVCHSSALGSGRRFSAATTSRALSAGAWGPNWPRPFIQ